MSDTTITASAVLDHSFEVEFNDSVNLSDTEKKEVIDTVYEEIKAGSWDAEDIACFIPWMEAIRYVEYEKDRREEYDLLLKMSFKDWLAYQSKQWRETYDQGYKDAKDATDWAVGPPPF
jgi:hypothetical protein